LFRILNSFAMMHAGSEPARNQSQFTARGIVPQKARPHTRQFSAFLWAAEPAEAIGRLLSWNRAGR
jgi:hypothetical protein